jgi:hypothetical protein
MIEVYYLSGNTYPVKSDIYRLFKGSWDGTLKAWKISIKTSKTYDKLVEFAFENRLTLKDDNGKVVDTRPGDLAPPIKVSLSGIALTDYDIKKSIEKRWGHFSNFMAEADELKALTDTAVKYDLTLIVDGKAVHKEQPVKWVRMCGKDTYPAMDKIKGLSYGAVFDKAQRCWNVPYKTDTKLDLIINLAEKYENLYVVDNVTNKVIFKKDPVVNKPMPRDPNKIYLSEGSGYRGSPYTPNEVIFTKQHGYLYIESASKQYFKEDGLSVGVGDDSGWVYRAVARPATDEESLPLRIKHERGKVVKETLHEFRELSEYVMKKGELPKGSFNLSGKTFGMPMDLPSIYGGGSWFVMEGSYLWYIQNNGMDGDDWSRNNVVTGGAGAIGWRVRLTSELRWDVEFLVDKAKELGIKL